MHAQCSGAILIFCGGCHLIINDGRSILFCAFYFSLPVMPVPAFSACCNSAKNWDVCTLLEIHSHLANWIFVRATQLIARLSFSPLDPRDAVAVTAATSMTCLFSCSDFRYAVVALCVRYTIIRPRILVNRKSDFRLRIVLQARFVFSCFDKYTGVGVWDRERKSGWIFKSVYETFYDLNQFDCKTHHTERYRNQSKFLWGIATSTSYWYGLVVARNELTCMVSQWIDLTKTAPSAKPFESFSPLRKPMFLHWFKKP